MGFASEDDWFDYKLEHDPRFLQRIARARGKALRPERASSSRIWKARGKGGSGVAGVAKGAMPCRHMTGRESAMGPSTISITRGCWRSSGPRSADLLPAGYYVMAEQIGGDLGAPDVLTLQAAGKEAPLEGPLAGTATLTESPPAVHSRTIIPAIRTARWQRTVVIRHTSGDRIVAMVEILSSGTSTLRLFFIPAVFGGRSTPPSR